MLIEQIYRRINYNSVSKCIRLLCTHSNVDFYAKDNFTPEQHCKILQTLNDSPPEILSRYRISNARIKSLLEWKLRRGHFKTLKEVLEVDGFGENSLEDVCKRIVNNSLSKSKSSSLKYNKYFKHLVFPEMDPHLSTVLKTAVAIYIDATGIGWVTLNRNANTVSEWKYKNLSTYPTQMLPTDTFGLAVEALEMTPLGDVYIFEAQPSLNPQNNPNKVFTHNHQVEIMSMLLALLNTSVKHNQTLQNEGNKFENRVFYLKNRLPARLFNTLMGYEKVSAIPKIIGMLKGDTEVMHSLPCTGVSIDNSLTQYFKSENSMNKELLSQALMLGISFMDLCVYKNKKSFEALTGKNQKGKQDKCVNTT
ncbi:uncharacterized protein [Euwallacea similis]|uniref:uncharacterized protein n=1 Tax=Euwallacea similis TaxID=1736056 RepID=UPI00344BE95C